MLQRRPVDESPVSLHSYNILRRSKLGVFMRLLAKTVRRRLQETLKTVNCHATKRYKVFNQVDKHATKNCNLSLHMAFQRIKVVGELYLKNERNFSHMIILLARIQKYKMKICFGLLQFNWAKANARIVDNFLAQRGKLFKRKIDNLIKTKKTIHFEAIKKIIERTKSLAKLKVISIIFAKLKENLLQHSFCRLLLYGVKCTDNQASKQVEDLKMILGDKDAQLQNKIDQIRRLEQDIAQVKTESLQFCESPSNNSAHNWSYRSRGSDKASSQGRIDDYSDGDFKVDLPSYGCVLKGSRQRLPRMDLKCICGYEQKYRKIRIANQSLKNQLQHMKEELAVAKDLNDHFTGQINNYLSGQSMRKNEELLHKELQSLREERDKFRQRNFKYQKHINFMKTEFRAKIEELYRKIKKDRE